MAAVRSSVAPRPTAIPTRNVVSGAATRLHLMRGVPSEVQQGVHGIVVHGMSLMSKLEQLGVVSHCLSSIRG